MKHYTKKSREQSAGVPDGVKFAFAIILTIIGIYLTFHLIVAIIIGIPLLILGGGLIAKYWPRQKR
jgi:hypothetical protein